MDHVAEGDEVMAQVHRLMRRSFDPDTLRQMEVLTQVARTHYFAASLCVPVSPAVLAAAQGLLIDDTMPGYYEPGGGR